MAATHIFVLHPGLTAGRKAMLPSDVFHMLWQSYNFASKIISDYSPSLPATSGQSHIRLSKDGFIPCKSTMTISWV